MREGPHSTDDINESVGGDLFDRYFTGEHKAVEAAPRTWFITADYVNLAAYETDAGLLLVDTGTAESAETVHSLIRKQTDAPLHTVVFTHGHLDHAFGLKPWIDAGERPRIVAHENVARRFRTYMKTAPLNSHINSVQFGIDEDISWPHNVDEFAWPDTVYQDRLTLILGGERFELYHAKGETDDATWVWAADRNIVSGGDLLAGILPNCGNPQKVQRYPEEWADALEAIASVGADLLLPGHGKLVRGADVIRERCLVTAAALRAIVEQVLAGLNAGKIHEEILATIEIPAELAKNWYIDPLYDRPEFIARNVIRKYGGWWNGYSAELMAAPMPQCAAEIVKLAGGVEPLISRARELKDSDPAMACHLAEWVALGAPESRAAHECAIEVFEARAEDEIALMARGIYNHAVRRSEAALEAMDERLGS
jgi:glyoxylase-like metal-dependent hydrolase (beta-lactamase superfamily II)